MKFILGKKIEMSQMFNENKEIVPVTLIEAGPCFVTQIKTNEKDKYESVQIGFEKLKEKKITKNKNKKPYRHLREFKGDVSKYKVGDKIEACVFAENDKVIISGVSKGKGFAGGVKKWGFHGRNASHGVKHEERTIGSVGRRFPQRVPKGKKMPGRLGSDRVTVKGLRVIKVEGNLIVVKGAIPGKRGTLLEIKA